MPSLRGSTAGSHNTPSRKNSPTHAKTGQSSSKGKSIASTRKSLKSGSSVHTRLLSAKTKGSTPDDNRPKKVTIKTPDFGGLDLRREDIAFNGLTQLPNELFMNITAYEIQQRRLSLDPLNSQTASLLAQKNWLTELQDNDDDDKRSSSSKDDLSKRNRLQFKLSCASVRNHTLEKAMCANKFSRAINETIYNQIPSHMMFWHITQKKALSAGINVNDIGELDISGNNLRAIPADIGKLTQLRALNLSQNSLKCSTAEDFTGLPQELFKLTHLEVVAISECNLRFIPAAIFQCITIKRLDISRNKFQMLSSDIGNLVDLEYLNASETSIKSLPPEIAFCERLQEINLYGNILDTLPETMRELRELTELKLNARSFYSNIDEYMNKLLRNGQIKSEHIPNVLFDIPELRTLDLDSTRINTLPAKNSCKLEELHLSRNYFVSVPQGIKTLPYLIMLDLSHNFITNLPDNMPEYLPNVQTLRLTRNSLTFLPPSICNLITLEELEIGNNKLTQLPNSIGNLTQLRVLRTPNNQLSSLPESLCQLLDLETLELTNNRIYELPLKMFNLTKIKQMHAYSHMKPMGLWLHKNPIVEPPEVIWKGVHIKPLHDYLRKLQIRRTENMQPLKIITLGEQECGKTSLVKTLATGKCLGNRHDEELVTTYLSASEKSNLMKRISRDKLLEEAKGDEVSTNIVKIQQWQSENAIRFCCYDMGGANVYKILHQFLLDDNALYLLIYDHSKCIDEDNYYEEIGYWLDLLQIHVPGSVVKIVSSKADLSENITQTTAKVAELVTNQLDEYKASLATELQKLKDQIADVKKAAAEGRTGGGSNITQFDPHANLMQLDYQLRQTENLLEKPLKIQGDQAVVSCAEGLRGIQDLITDIEMIAVNKQLMPHCQRYIPPSWKKLKMSLKKKSGYYLTRIQVKEIADKFKIQGEVLEDALDYLHSCGEIMWLQKHNQLKHIVFHKPQQLVEVLRGVFNHDIDTILNYQENKTFSSHGKLTQEQFIECKERMIKYGEISRQILISLWYYLPMNREEFIATYELLSMFHLAYIVPQSDVPTSNSYSEPLLIIPWYVREEMEQHYLDHYWSTQVEQEQRELEIIYTFPLQFPEGVFERLSATLQAHANIRLDWANTVYMETADTKVSRLLIRKYKSIISHCDIKVRSSDLRTAMQSISKIHQTWVDILTSIPGLVWRVSRYSAKKHAKTDKASTSPCNTSKGNQTRESSTYLIIHAQGETDSEKSQTNRTAKPNSDLAKEDASKVNTVDINSLADEQV